MLSCEDDVDVVHLTVGEVLDEHPYLAEPEVVQRGRQLVDALTPGLDIRGARFLVLRVRGGVALADFPDQLMAVPHQTLY